MIDIALVTLVCLIALTSFSIIGYFLFDLYYGKSGGTKGLSEVPFTSPLSGKTRTAKKSRQDHIVWKNGSKAFWTDG